MFEKLKEKQKPRLIAFRNFKAQVGALQRFKEEALVMKDQLLLSYKILMQGSALAVQKGSDEWRVSPRRVRINNLIAVKESFIVLAKNLYQRECQQCHGTGKWDSPIAAALTSPEALRQSDSVIRYRLYDHAVRFAVI